MKTHSGKRLYQKPTIRSEQEPLEPTMNCPTTNVKYCGISYSPKKGQPQWVAGQNAQSVNSGHFIFSVYLRYNM